MELELAFSEFSPLVLGFFVSISYHGTMLNIPLTYFFSHIKTNRRVFKNASQIT